MLDLLKQFEEDSFDNPFANPETNNDDGINDLEQRLAGIDLGEFYLAEFLWVRSTELLVPRIRYRLR
jgi:hypothetical protein